MTPCHNHWSKIMFISSTVPKTDISALVRVLTNQHNDLEIENELYAYIGGIPIRAQALDFLPGDHNNGMTTLKLK